MAKRQPILKLMRKTKGKRQVTKGTKGAEGNTFFAKAQNDHTFREACDRAGIPPTGRQYSKWVRKFGAAYANK